MSFEGSEKKFEIIINPQSESLRKYSFYPSLLKKAKTKVVNQFSNSHCDAYILSESSLFVWEHRLTLITCGKTTLSSAVLYLVKHLDKEAIQALFFQRKNELFPLGQKTSFEYDVIQLRKKFEGKALRFGHLDEHHFFLFHLEQSYLPHPKDHTIEILMYDIQGELNSLFKSSAPAEQIRSALNLESSFPGFTLQDHAFQPQGYSLNALRGEEYYTIHVTPQEPGYYVSFETNMENPSEVLNKVIRLFRPLRLDVITFFPFSYGEDFQCELDGFVKNVFSKKRLNCGFDVQFSAFSNIKSQASSPYTW
ncbi:MAG: adenosylmethionine decarboxylase [Bdellovibrionales bacterium]|nr:adenosylmethionine decarboxylase [Bdellovibrionales bacterium]